MNSFPRKGDLKHYPPSAIMTGAKLCMSRLQLKFGSYCQVAEDVTPRNSLAAHMPGAVSIELSGNLSGGQSFFALDTGKLIVRNQCIEQPMSLAVIDRVNVLGHARILFWCSLIALVKSLASTHPMLVKLVMVMTTYLL